MILSVCRTPEEEALMKGCTYAYRYPSSLVLKSFREDKKGKEGKTGEQARIQRRTEPGDEGLEEPERGKPQERAGKPERAPRGERQTRGERRASLRRAERSGRAERAERGERTGARKI